MAERPLAIDLYTGLSGWGFGLVAAGWRAIGFDIQDMFALLGEPKPEHFHLVIQDVLTLHGSQFKDARLIVGSSPCTKYSYMAMPWTRSKALAAWYREDPARQVELNALYDAQFRIQREASQAAGRHIPMVVENVKGAQPWVGRARANFGSYYLFGDVPALMPQLAPRKRPGHNWSNFRATGEKSKQWNEGSGHKVPGFRFDGSGASFQTAAVNEHIKNEGGPWFNIGSPGQKVVAQNPDGRLVHRRDGAPHTKHLTNAAEHSQQGGQTGRRYDMPGDMKPPARVSAEAPADGRKGAGAGAVWFDQNTSSLPSASPRRKAASAKIAKIPFTLAEWIGRVHLPEVSPHG